MCLGGRGREWAAESLKLLETMSELKDAKIFLEPMDPLKYAVSMNITLLSLPVKCPSHRHHTFEPISSNLLTKWSHGQQG